MNEKSQQRKPPGISWESFTERRIREAQEAGMFDALPGAGKPIPGIDEPLDENWWVKQKLRDEGVNVLPPLLAARLDIEHTLKAILNLADESDVRKRLHQLNQRVREAQKSPASAPPLTVSQVNIDAEVTKWRATRNPPLPSDP